MRGLGLGRLGFAQLSRSTGIQWVTVPYDSNSAAIFSGERIWTGMFGFAQVSPAVLVPSEGNCYALHAPDTFDGSTITGVTPPARTPLSVWGYPQYNWRSLSGNIRLDLLGDLWVYLDTGLAGSQKVNLLYETYPSKYDDANYSGSPADNKLVEVGVMIHVPQETIDYHAAMSVDLGFICDNDGLEWIVRYKPGAGSSQLGYCLAIPADPENDRLVTQFNVADFIRLVIAYLAENPATIYVKHQYLGMEMLGGADTVTMTRNLWIKDYNNTPHADLGTPATKAYAAWLNRLI